MGRLATPIRTDVTFDPSAPEADRPSLGDSFEVWQSHMDALASDRHHAAPADVALVGGSISPNQAAVRVLPDPDTDETELLQIDLDAVADGRQVFLACGIGLTPIKVRHLPSGLSDVGEIELADATDLTLTSPDDFLALQRVGNRFRQSRTISTAALRRLSQDVDMAGFAAYGGKYFVEEHTSGARTISTADRGKLLVNKASCTYTLPIAQPPSGAQWQVGDKIDFRQEAASCIFVRSGGGAPRNIDSHDRGRGVGAKMELELVQISPSFVWNLVGMTTAPGGGGGTVRTYAKASSPNTVSTDPGSTTWKDILTLTHTPGNSERWLYLGHMGVKGAANLATMTSYARIARGGTGPEFGGPRYSTGQEAPLLVLGASYGASPGSQDVTLGVKSGNATYATSGVGPALVGIRLETGEFLQLAAGSANNITGTTYADLVTMTQSFAADDYYIFFGCAWDTSAQIGCTLAIDVDGSLKHEKSMSFHTSENGFFGGVVPVTLTAASHTIKLKAKCNHAGNGTITQMVVCALKKSLFQDVASANDGTATTTSSTSYVDKATLSRALLASWDYLVVGDIDLMVDNQAAAVGALGQLTRNSARVGQAARSVPRDPSTWCPVSAGFMAVVQKQQPTDAFAVQYGSQVASDTVSGKEASILVLSLAPV